MNSKRKIPNEQQEKEICEIILSGGKIHTNVYNYLRDNNLQRTSRNRNGFTIKKFIRYLIDKYELNKIQHINEYDCLYPLTQTEFDVIVGGLLGDT